MKKLFKNLFSWYVIKSSLLIWAVTFIVYPLGNYYGSHTVSGNLYLPIDDLIPYIPWTVIIYFGCYVFWVINYMLACKKDSCSAYKFAISEICGKLVCMLFYIMFPTTMIRQQVFGNSIWDSIVKFIYTIDQPSCLFPSIHCFNSWMAFRGISDKDYISKWYKGFSLVFALAICISTLTVKQHVFVDFPSAIILAEACMLIYNSDFLDNFVKKLINKNTGNN